MLGAAVLDDVLGLVLLSALVAMLTPTLSVTGHVMRSLAQAVAFIAAGLAIGPYIADGAVALSRRTKDTTVLLVLAFSYFLVLAWAARVAGLEMIIGAYAAGLAFSGHRERERLELDLRPLLELLTPLFFVLVGASVQLSGLSLLSSAGRGAWGFMLTLLLAAGVSKLLSAAPLRGGLNRWVIGSGMLPRGEVGLVFAQIGLTAGLFRAEVFSMVVLTLVATTLAGPVLLRLVWEPTRAPAPAST